MRRRKKRYVLLNSYPETIPENTDFLYQDSHGFLFKTTLHGAEQLREQAIFVSGSMKKLKKRMEWDPKRREKTKGLNAGARAEKDGMK